MSLLILKLLKNQLLAEIDVIKGTDHFVSSASCFFLSIYNKK